MSKSSANLFIIAIIAGIVVVGGYLMLRGTPEPVDTIAPMAVAGIDIAGETGDSFLLDGAKSTDNIGIVEYRWQMGAESKEGVLVVFDIDEEGVYLVTLIVKDETGNTGQDTVQITVSDPPEIEPTPEPTPDPEPEPSVSPVINGIIEMDEYDHTTSDSSTGITVSWTTTDNEIFVALDSPGSGWVSIGFDPDSAMKGANFIFGYVTSEATFARDEYGTGLFSHESDTSNGGTDDIIEYAGSESSGTGLEFSIPLDSGDSKDRELTSGSSYTCLLAYSGSDNFTTKHSKRGSITISLD